MSCKNNDAVLFQLYNKLRLMLTGNVNILSVDMINKYIYMNNNCYEH